MTYTPLISVIMPVYNTERFVGEAIESILNQTFTDFEFIVIDDGSTDSSREIIQHYAQQDQRIRAFQNEENKGISYTRNKLIELTNTNYIATQDSDDISLPQRLELSYNYLENHPKCAVV
ncbi:MAG: glycosyltransferase family 2 protein [Candidatus Peribacteria bacterium]|nr:MAG: glycosyltransferase family 2 protein [Candidatus Peribacteria bacterium]